LLCNILQLEFCALCKNNQNLETAVIKENQDLEDVKALLKAVSIAALDLSPFSVPSQTFVQSF
jgi:hypothetical protein